MVQDCSSISGAARKLGVDQPHVTRQLQRIERCLDFDVFVRTHKGVTPTAAGLRVLALARRALAVMDEIGAPAVPTPDRRGREPLRILYHRVPAITVLDDLCRVHPGLPVRLLSASAHEAHEHILRGAADIFLGVRLPHVTWPQHGSLTAEQVLTDPTVVHLAADHPFAAREQLDLMDLSTENWIAGADRDNAAMISQECLRAGGFEPAFRHRVDDEATLAALLARGLGITIGSSMTSYRRAVGLPYQGSSPAHWMLVHDPERVDSTLIATVAGSLRRRYGTKSPFRSLTSLSPLHPVVPGAAATTNVP